MSMHKTLLGIAMGVGCGITLVVACGDDAPVDVDAAGCDCEPAEPPLSGRITQVVEGEAEIAPGSNTVIGSSCPDGGVVLGGGCSVPLGSVFGLYLQVSAPGDGSWTCQWWNDSSSSYTGTATAICLLPAE